MRPVSPIHIPVVRDARLGWVIRAITIVGDPSNPPLRCIVWQRGFGPYKEVHTASHHLAASSVRAQVSAAIEDFRLHHQMADNGPRVHLAFGINAIHRIDCKGLRGSTAYEARRLTDVRPVYR